MAFGFPGACLQPIIMVFSEEEAIQNIVDLDFQGYGFQPGISIHAISKFLTLSAARCSLGRSPPGNYSPETNGCPLKINGWLQDAFPIEIVSF